MSQALLLSLAVVASSTLVCAAVALAAFGLRGRTSEHANAPDLSEQDAVFVFRDDTLVDQSDRGRQLLESIMAANTTKRQGVDHLLEYLGHRFADLKTHLGQLVSCGAMELQAQDDSGLCCARAERTA